jgi:hypothetical protein
MMNKRRIQKMEKNRATNHTIGEEKEESQQEIENKNKKNQVKRRRITRKSEENREMKKLEL